MFNGAGGDGDSALPGHRVLDYAVQQGTVCTIQAGHKQTLRTTGLLDSDWLMDVWMFHSIKCN